MADILNIIGSTVTKSIYLQPGYTSGGTTYAAWPFRLGIKLTLKSQEGMKSVIHYETYADTSYGYARYLSFFPLALYETDPFRITLNGNAVLSTQSFAGVQYFSGNKVLSSGDFELIRTTETNIGDLQLAFIIPSNATLQGDSSNPSPFNGTAYLTPRTETFSIEVYSTTTSGSSATIESVSDFTDETNPTIIYNYDRGINVDGVSLLAGISFTGENMDIPYREIDSAGNSYTFEFTQDELNTLYTLLKNGTTASVRFYLQTVELIGDETIYLEPAYIVKTFNFINYTPVLTPVIQDTNDVTTALTGNSSHIIKYFSKVAYDMNVTLRKGAMDVIGCYIQNGGRIEEGFTEGTFENPTSNIFYFSATDDRGYTGTASKSLSTFDGEFIEYIKLTTSIKSTPISADGDMSFTLTGKYFNASFGAAQNKLIVQYAIYKKGTTPSWSTAAEVTPEMLDNTTYEVSFSQSGLDYTAQYVVAVKVNDLLMNSEASVSVVAKPVFYWNANEFIFNVPVTFNEGLEVNLYEEATTTGYYMSSSGSYASGDYTWHYRKWNDGLLECWCTVPIATRINVAWGNLYTSSTLYQTDLCYPIQPTATPLITVSLGAGVTKGMLITDNSYAADNISTGRYNIASPVSNTSNTIFKLNYYIRGRWK